MHVAVIGAGIVGVTTAYELAADGHRVTVFERRGSVAAESSFANAGLIAPGSVVPWAAPGLPLQLLRSMASRHAPLRLRRRGIEWSTVRWLWQWWRACNLRTYEANRLRMQRLAGFSQDRLHELTRTLHLDYERADGCLLLLRSARELGRVQPALASLAARGSRFETLDAAGCRLVEPGLGSETPLHAGIHLPDDEVGNCRQFAVLLRTEAERLGVRFRFHATVQRLLPGRNPELTYLQFAPGDMPRPGGDGSSPDAADTRPMADGPQTRPFDAIIVCAALGAAALLQPHGLKLPLLAVHGYSVTAPLRRNELHPDQGPRSAVLDQRHQIAISRLGDRVRVAGLAEIGGHPLHSDHHPKAMATLYQVLHDWFPGAAQLARAQRWRGARPMLPDGPPVLGASGIDGVWLNLGHGSNGWALACGSARLVADALVGRAPAVDIDGLGVSRLHQLT